MNQNKHNFARDLNLLIPNIDTTSERLSSDNTPGTFIKNNLTDNNLMNPYQGQFKINNGKNEFQKYQIPKTMRDTPKNYSNIKENHYSQKETQDLTHKKPNIISKKNTNTNIPNEETSKNYKNIVKKINMVSSEKTKKNKIHQIPIKPRKSDSKIYINDDKDSYIYLLQLKKNYSMNKMNRLKDDNSINAYRNNKSGGRQNLSKENIFNKKNLTVGGFYPNRNNLKNNNLSQKPHNNNNFLNENINNNKPNKENKLNRNISSSYINRVNITNNNSSNYNNINNNDLSEILNVRKKFNESCKYFYNNNNKANKPIKTNKTNKTIKAIYNKEIEKNSSGNHSFKKINIIKSKKNKNNNSNLYYTSEYSTINSYWNKRAKDTIQKMTQIKNDILQKEENEIQLIPKINQKSKELILNSDKYNIEFNNIYDRLFYINNLNLNLNIDKQNNNKNKIKNSNQIEYQPLINEKSQNMKRTIDDLYIWQNQKEKKIKQNEEDIFKKTVYNKKNTNLTSEIMLKERRPHYINKKVEDRLIEQGKKQQIKKEKEKERNIHQLIEQKIFVNNNYNNIKSRYMEPKNNNINDENDGYLKQNENNRDSDIVNYYSIVNMRNYDNFNKKCIYYGDKLDSDSVYFYNKLNKSNKSLNKNHKNISSKTPEKIKSFDDNNYLINNNNTNNINLISKNISNINNFKDNQNQNCQNISFINPRIPKDFNKISRPPASKSNDKSNNNTNLSTSKINFYNNYSYNNIITESKNNENSNKNNQIKSSYYSLLYNDMLNNNLKIVKEANNISHNNKITNKNDNLKLNINNNNNNEINSESSIKSYLSSLNNINNRINVYDNNNMKREKKDNNDKNINTAKFNYNEYPIINNINNNSNNNNIPMNNNNNIKDKFNNDTDIVNINFNNSNKREQNNYIYNMNNEILNQITSSVSSSNTSKIERRDKRKEDLKKIINFSDNLYNSLSKENAYKY